eukprot:767560-Hanusia_phi.AAC.2
MIKSRPVQLYPLPPEPEGGCWPPGPPGPGRRFNGPPRPLPTRLQRDGGPEQSQQEARASVSRMTVLRSLREVAAGTPGDRRAEHRPRCSGGNCGGSLSAAGTGAR